MLKINDNFTSTKLRRNYVRNRKGIVFIETPQIQRKHKNILHNLMQITQINFNAKKCNNKHKEIFTKHYNEYKPLIAVKNENWDQIMGWYHLRQNPVAVSLILQHKKTLETTNGDVAGALKPNPLNGSKYERTFLCSNPSPVYLKTIETENAMKIEDNFHYNIMTSLTETTKRPRAINWTAIFLNPYSVSFLTDNWDRIKTKMSDADWDELYSNASNASNAFLLIKKDWDWLIAQNKINWTKLCANLGSRDVIAFLEEKLDDIYTNLDWGVLCSNPNAIPLIEKYFELLKQKFESGLLRPKVSTPCFWSDNLIAKFNEPDVSKYDYLLDENTDGIDLFGYKDFDNNYYHNYYIIEPTILWDQLCANPNAIGLIEKYWDWLIQHNKINFELLCANPNAIGLIEMHWDWFIVKNPYLDFEILCANPNAIPLINKHWNIIKTKNICWNKLYANPNSVPFLRQICDEIPNKKIAELFKAINKIENEVEKQKEQPENKNKNEVEEQKENEIEEWTMDDIFRQKTEEELNTDIKCNCLCSIPYICVSFSNKKYYIIPLLFAILLFKWLKQFVLK